MARLRNDHPARRAAIVAWCLFTLIICVKAAVQPTHRTVYPYFSEAARHWWSNRDLYAHYEGFDPYRYSPTFAIVMTPFGILPDSVGGVLWNIANMGLLYYAVSQAVRHLFPMEYTEKNHGIILLLTLAGSARGLWSAQCNSLILSLVMLGMMAVQRKKWWGAATLLALPAYIKLWPLLPAILATVRWPRKLAWRGGIALAVLAAVPFLTQSVAVVVSQYMRWYETLTGPLQQRWGGYRDMWTIWENVAPPVDHDAYSILQGAGFCATIAVALGLKWRGVKDREFLTLILSAWTSFQLLLGPGAERLTYGLIAVPMAWATIASLKNRRALALISTTWFVTFVLGSGAVERAIAPFIPGSSSAAPMGILCFVVWLIHYHSQIALDNATDENPLPATVATSAERMAA